MHKNSLRVRVPIYILIAANIAFIWSMSLFSIEDSGEQSGRIMALLLKLFPFLGDIFGDSLGFVIRKFAHFTEFASLGLLCALALWEHTLHKGSSFYACSPAVLLACLAVASTDETIQIFTGRGNSVRDVMIDFSGALCGFAAVSLIRLIYNKMKHKQS